MDGRFVIQLAHNRVTLASLSYKDGAWSPVSVRLAKTPVPVMPQTDGDVAELSARLSETFTQWRPNGLTARLIIPSTWCMVHPVNTTKARRGREEWRFDFEQYLPVELDRMTCSLAVHPSGHFLAVAAFTDPLRHLIDTLEDSEIAIESILVDAFLPLEVSLTGDESLQRAICLLDESRCTVIQNHAPSNDTARMSTRLNTQQIIQHDEWPSFDVAGNGMHSRGLLNPITIDLLHECEDGTSAQVAEGAFRRQSDSANVCDLLAIAAGDNVAPDLRCSSLAFHRYTSRLIVHARQTGLLVICLLLAVSLNLWLKALDYRSAAYALDATCAEAYQSVYPDQSLPPAAALRLRSQRIELQATTKNVEFLPGSAGANGLAALRTLGMVIEAIPDRLKLSVGEIQAESDRVRVSGSTTGHQQVGQLAQAINELPGMQAEPPRTKLRKDGTVEFNIVVTQSSDER